MKAYYDPMYGEIELDGLVLDIVEKCPELMRLRFIGMMNFKSLRMLPLTTITRLEHTMGLAYLTQLCVSQNCHLESWKHDLLVAALYHDVNCGSFGHSVEWAIDRFSSYNHEEEIAWVRQTSTLEGLRAKPIFLEQDGLHRHGFGDKYGINFKRVDELINGVNSYILNNTGIDLDNIDNVLRMAHYLGRLPKNDLGTRLVSSLQVRPDQDNFVTDDEGAELVDQWRLIRSDVYRRFLYFSEYMSFEHLVFELIREYAKFFENESITSVFHYTDERLLWSLCDGRRYSPRLRGIAKRLLLHDLPYCHGILRCSEFHLKKHLEQENRLLGIADRISQDLARITTLKQFARRPAALHLTTDDRKTNRAIPIIIERDGISEELVLGEDRRYLLVSVLSDNFGLDQAGDSMVLELAASALRDNGVSQVDIFAGQAYWTDSSQYDLL